MAVGVSCGVFKSWLLLRVEMNFYIGTGGVFKGIELGVARFAGLDLGARMCFTHFYQSGHQDPSVCFASKN